MIGFFWRSIQPRDKSRFPIDDNGDILYKIWKEEGDIDREIVVDFSIVFSSKASAQECVEHLKQYSQNIKISFFEEKNCWDLLLPVSMVPTWKSITAMEETIANIVMPHGGSNDGWGFFSN